MVGRQCPTQPMSLMPNPCSPSCLNSLVPLLSSPARKDTSSWTSNGRDQRYLRFLFLVAKVDNSCLRQKLSSSRRSRPFPPGRGRIGWLDRRSLATIKRHGSPNVCLFSSSHPRTSRPDCRNSTRYCRLGGIIRQTSDLNLYE